MKSEATFIRQATLNDIEQVIRLLAQYRQFYRCEENLNKLKNFIEKRLKKYESVIFLAFQNKDDDKAVGVAQLYPVFSTLSLGKAWILNDLFVERSHRRLGVGEDLIDASSAFAKQDGAFRLDLKTERDNLKAQSLYDKKEFKQDGKYIHYSLLVP